MPRLIRRRPLAERIKSYLNPLDFLLWLSEEIDANDWDQFEKDWALPLGIGLNVVFMIARANSRANGSKAVDDVFGDDGRAPWLSWFVCCCLFFLFVLLNFMCKTLIANGKCTIIGLLHCPSARLLLRIQCFLYFLSETSLSHV